MTTNPFAQLLSPFTSAFKRPATPATGDTKKAPQYSILSAPPGRPVSPFNIPQRGAGLQMTPLPNNMSTPNGPVRVPTPTFNTSRAVPEVTNTPAISTPVTPVVNPPVAPLASAGNFTTPSGAVVDAQGNTVSSPTGAGTGPGGPSTPAVPQVSPETQKAIDSAEAAVTEATKITPEELSTQGDIDRLIESTKKAFQNTTDQPIPLEFITGQLKSIESRALGLAEPLEAKLARLQGKRTSALESSRFSLDRADKKAANEIGRADTIRTEAESARRFGLGQENIETQQNLAQNKFDEDVRQFGLQFAQSQEKLNASDAKAEASGSDTDIADALQGKINFIDEIFSHSGLNSRVGPTGFSRRTFAASDKFGAGQDFSGSVRQLASQEFLDKLINVKSQGATFGALTDREGDALRAAATKINDWEVKDEDGNGIGEWNIDEASFRKELTKIQTLAKKGLDKAGAILSQMNGATDFAEERGQLREGEILVERNGEVGAIPSSEFNPKTDKKI